MNEDNLLGRDPLGTERDSIWLKPKPPKEEPLHAPSAPPTKAFTEKDYSKVIQTEEAPEKLCFETPRDNGPIKAGPPLIQKEQPPAVSTPVPSANPATAPVTPAPEAAKQQEEADEEEGIEEILQLVGFKLAREFFGIAIINVQEIIRHQEITAVPRTPEFVEGVISLRGKVIPVINLRKRFGLEEYKRTKATRIIIAELDFGMIGFIVDSVTEVTSIPKKSIDPAPPTATGINKEYIQGVGKIEDKLMIILDLNQVLSAESKKQIKSMAV